jgi:hypothetical protein
MLHPALEEALRRLAEAAKELRDLVEQELADSGSSGSSADSGGDSNAEKKRD